MEIVQIYWGWKCKDLLEGKIIGGGIVRIYCRGK